MAWLERAVAGGSRYVAGVKDDKDLDALRDRADFEKLVARSQARRAEKER
jgi:hypothetical protein